MKLKIATLIALIGSLLFCFTNIYQLIRVIQYSSIEGIIFSLLIFFFSASLVLFFLTLYQKQPDE